MPTLKELKYTIGGHTGTTTSCEKMCKKDIFPFGKYKGSSVKVVLASDPGYIVWFYENVKGLKIKKKIYTAAQEAVAQKEQDRPVYYRRRSYCRYPADYSESDWDINNYDLCIDGW